MNAQISLQLEPPEPAAQIYFGTDSLAYVWPASTGFLRFAVFNADTGEVAETARSIPKDLLERALDQAGFDMKNLLGHQDLSQPEWLEEAKALGVIRDADRPKSFR